MKTATTDTAGPSGCGKTTTLRMIAGLERPSDGQISIADEVIADGSSFRKPEERNVGIVFQDFALFPHSPSPRTSRSA